ncbi:inversin protein alternative isoform, putative [hydrothermal vent metagenome]|uniref:Inversin protein alternative isoform, putative n=1 Tax=hydrothermal vent metagenome TaxID=652676 RepID=A0A1W1CCF6_9ZZZZ
MFKRSLTIIAFLLFTQQGLNATVEVKVADKDVISAINKGVNATQKFLKKVPTYQLYKDEKSILHYAVELKKYDVVEYLVDKVDLSAKGGIYYETPLQDAIFYGNLRIAELLIRSGTNLDIKNVDGETALHIAAKYGYADIIKQLIRAGASTNVYDEDGNTPKDVLPELMWENHKELIQKLEPVDEDDGGTQAIQSKKMIIKSTNGTTKSIITIDRENKSIYEENIDKKSHIENSDIGIVID